MSDKNKEGLIRVSEIIKEALMGNDLDTMARYYHRDYRGFSLRGEVETFQQIRRAYQPGAATLTAHEVQDRQIEVFGEVGIITGTGFVSGNFGAHQFQHRIRYTDIFLYRDHRWQCYRSHATEMV